MLEKLLKNKKIWIPIVVLVVVTAIVLGVSLSKNADDTDGKEQSDINISSGLDKDKEQSDTGSDTEDSKENGLTEVQDGISVTEDTITPPESWDGNDASSNGSGNNQSNTTDNSDENNKDNNKDNPNQDNDNADDTGMSSGEVFADKEKKQFGTIF